MPTNPPTPPIEAEEAILLPGYLVNALHSNSQGMRDYARSEIVEIQKSLSKAKAKPDKAEEGLEAESSEREGFDSPLDDEQLTGGELEKEKGYASPLESPRLVSKSLFDGKPLTEADVPLGNKHPQFSVKNALEHAHRHLIGGSGSSHKGAHSSESSDIQGQRAWNAAGSYLKSNPSLLPDHPTPAHGKMPNEPIHDTDIEWSKDGGKTNVYMERHPGNIGLDEFSKWHPGKSDSEIAKQHNEWKDDHAARLKKFHDAINGIDGGQGKKPVNARDRSGGGQGRMGRGFGPE